MDRVYEPRRGRQRTRASTEIIFARACASARRALVRLPADTSTGLALPKNLPRVNGPLPAWFRTHALHEAYEPAEWIDTWGRSFDTDVHETSSRTPQEPL